MPALIALGREYSGSPGKDSSALVLGTQEWGSSLDLCVIKGAGADWALKMPGNRDSLVRRCPIFGGRERALDIVQGGNLDFEACTFGCGTERQPITTRWSLRKQCDIGIKAGADGVRFAGCVMTDLLLGDYSIYDHDGGPKTRGIELDSCKHPAGEDHPIIIRCLHAEPPKLRNTHAIILQVPAPIVAAYFAWCRTFGDTRKPSSP